MEEKIFDLLEKVYIDLQDTKKSISRLEVKVEHDISNKIDALFEFRDEALKRFDRIDNKLDELSDKIDKHDIKIQVIEGGKSKKVK